VNRYAILYRVQDAKRPETRTRGSRSSWRCWNAGRCRIR